MISMRKIGLVFSLASILLLSTEAFAHDFPPFKEPPHQIIVTGKATLQAPPDKATIRFSIITKDKKAEKARETNELTAKEVLNSVREMGVSDRLMQLESLNINEEQKYNAKTQTYEPDGYKASRSFVVELRDLDKLAGVIAAVVSHGSNDLNSVEYGLKDPQALRVQALQQATANAAQKADLMLSAVKQKRGAVISIEEVSDRFIGYPEAGFKRAQTMAVMADAAPIAEPDSFAQGHIEVEGSVRVVFQITEDTVQS